MKPGGRGRVYRGVTTATELSARLRSNAAHANHSVMQAVMRDAADALDNLDAQASQMEADCAALRKAYTDAGGISPTVPALIAAIQRGMVKSAG